MLREILCAILKGILQFVLCLGIGIFCAYVAMKESADTQSVLHTVELRDNAVLSAQED